jgi:hypothetical protein
MNMNSNLKVLLSTVVAAPIVVMLFAGVPALAQCNDGSAQALAQSTNPDLRDPHNDRLAQVANPDQRDPHNDRLAQVANPDQRDPHNDRLAQVANPDQRDPHNDRFAVASGCK